MPDQRHPGAEPTGEPLVELEDDLTIADDSDLLAQLRAAALAAAPDPVLDPEPDPDPLPSPEPLPSPDPEPLPSPSPPFAVSRGP